MARLEHSAYCRRHLFEECYERIDHYFRWLQSRSFRDSDDGFVRHFVAECTKLLTDVANTPLQLDNLERARLLDLLLRTADLGQHLRRGPRREARLPVRLASDKLGRTWEEETETQVISRCGAKLACQHAPDVGDLLLVVRLDTSQRAQARVAWCRQRGAGAYEIGIELLSCDNFWDVNWEEAEADSAARPSDPQHSR